MRAFGELPVGAAVAFAHHVDSSVFDIDERENPSTTEEERHQTEFECQMIDTRRRLRAKPLRIGDPDPASIDARLPGEEPDMQIAFDAHLAPKPVRGIAGDGSAQGIPVKEIKRNHHCGDDGQSPAAGPEHPFRHGAQQNWNPPICHAGAGVRRHRRGSLWARLFCHASRQSWSFCPENAKPGEKVGERCAPERTPAGGPAVPIAPEFQWSPVGWGFPVAEKGRLHSPPFRRRTRTAD